MAMADLDTDVGIRNVDTDQAAETGEVGFIRTENGNRTDILGHHMESGSAMVKVEKISRNCKRFNRLFHEGDDSSSLDDDSIPVITTSSYSSNNISSEIGILNGKPQASCSSNFYLQMRQVKEEQEIVLEIEIENDEDGIVTPISLTSPFSRTEDSTTSESADGFDVVKPAPICKPGHLSLPNSEQSGDKFSPLSPWNPDSYENDDEASNLDTVKIEVGDVEEDDEDQEGTKPKTPRVKREKPNLSLGERRSTRLGPKTTFCNKKHEAQVMKKVKIILKKDVDKLTLDEHQILEGFPALVEVVKKRLESRLLASERLKEFEDSEEILEEKCYQLSEVLRRAQYLVIYTGAGISTSAQIPDYRGPNGIWTLLKNGQSLDSQEPNVLTTADPTVTHMTIKQLYHQGVVKHIVSQNCDGLHLRSGVPKNALSEVHGNMYIEVCVKCRREYVRLFDVTENTRRHEHRTGRTCYNCGSEVTDSIVHFGERGSLRWPLNWAGAEYNVNKADVILCLGSSLKVLRRYPWLWGMDKPPSKRPKLFIVNLQWTPKDQYAALKIHGKCDEVMSRVMQKLNIPIPSYKREMDPIFSLATPLHTSELRSRSSRELTFPDNIPFPEKNNGINNYIRFEPEFRNSSPSDFEDNKKTGKKREILKGNGNGWLGNAWGVKPKKRKLK